MPYSLQISAKILSWPRMCVCCCGGPNAELRASASRTIGKREPRTTTYWWDVPACTSCLEHAKAFGGAPTFLTLGIGAGVIFWLLAYINGATFLAWVLGLLAVAGGIWGYRSANETGTANLQPSCSARTAPIRYVEWHGTFHTFVFASRDYLQAFIAANERKTMSDVRSV